MGRLFLSLGVDETEEDKVNSKRQGDKGRPPVIFMAAGSGYEARMLLRFAILSTLKASGATLVLLVPNPEEAYIRQEFEDSQVHIEELPEQACTQYLLGSRVQSHLRLLRNHALDTRQARYISDKARVRLRFSRHPSVRILDKSLVWLLQRSRWLRKAVVAAESRLFPGHLYASLLDRYQPDLVITGLPGYYVYDIFLLREAKARGIKTVAVITFWDSPHNMGLHGVVPDYLVAWSQTMKEELIRFQGFRADRIFVGGVASFDVHRRSDGFPSREELFQRYGLDPGRKLIVFGTKSPLGYPHIEIVEALVKAIDEGRFAYPSQLLVRLHPMHQAPEYIQNPALKGLMARYDAIRQRTPYLAYSLPQVLSSKLNTDMPLAESLELAAILHHADVLVTLFSTLVLEACLQDTPVINICYDPPLSQPIAGLRPRPIIVDMNQPQNIRVRASGGSRLAHSEEELTDLINLYLQNPGLDRAERQKLAEQECGPTDGEAGERIAQFILSLLKEDIS